MRCGDWLVPHGKAQLAKRRFARCVALAAGNIVILTTLAISAACNNAAAPVNCFQATATFSPTAPDFVATVSKVTYESGPTPAGFEMAQYAVWLTVSPHAVPNAGVVLSRATPVFERALTGGVRSTAACTINAGDMLEVWHDHKWALGAVEAPPGDTLYFPTQVVKRR